MCIFRRIISISCVAYSDNMFRSSYLNIPYFKFSLFKQLPNFSIAMADDIFYVWSPFSHFTPKGIKTEFGDVSESWIVFNLVLIESDTFLFEKSLNKCIKFGIVDIGNTSR